MKKNYGRHFLPQNHEGLFYLFSRNHEKLGFEQIVRIDSNSSPDIKATRNGVEVGIELEYNSSSVFEHYRVLSKKEQQDTESVYEENQDEGKYSPKGEWNKDGNLWNFVTTTGDVILTKEDPNSQFWLDSSRKILLYNTAKLAGIDVVVYWVEDDKFKFWEFDKDVEVIDLSKITNLV